MDRESKQELTVGTVKKRIGAFATDVAACWTQPRRLLIDVRELFTVSQVFDFSALNDLAKDLKSHSVRWAPVIHWGSPKREWTAIKKIARKTGLIGLQISVAELSEESVGVALDQVELAPEKVCLIVNAGRLENRSVVEGRVDDVLAAMNRLKSIHAFHQVIVLAGSYPESHGEFGREGLFTAERCDDQFFQQLTDKCSQIFLNFTPGDWIGGPPELEQRGGRGGTQVATVAYTTPSRWLISRAQKAEERGGAAKADYVRAVRRIIAHRGFRGRGTGNAGDQHYLDLATGVEGVGGALTAIIAAYTKSHIGYMVRRSGQSRRDAA